MKPKKRRPTDRIKVHWGRSSSPGRGITIERNVRGHLYTRQVRAGDFLSPPEAAVALGVTREFVYRLIWDRKLKCVRQSGRIAIPVSAVIAYNAHPSRRRRPAGS